MGRQCEFRFIPAGVYIREGRMDWKLGLEKRGVLGPALGMVGSSTILGSKPKNLSDCLAFNQLVDKYDCSVHACWSGARSASSHNHPLYAPHKKHYSGLMPRIHDRLQTNTPLSVV